MAQIPTTITQILDSNRQFPSWFRAVQLIPDGEFNCHEGDRGEVLVDGLRRNYITSGKEGVDGWVWQEVRVNGLPVVRDGVIVQRIIRGTVVFKPWARTGKFLRKARHVAYACWLAS